MRVCWSTPWRRYHSPSYQEWIETVQCNSWQCVFPTRTQNTHTCPNEKTYKWQTKSNQTPMPYSHASLDTWSTSKSYFRCHCPCISYTLLLPLQLLQVASAQWCDDVGNDAAELYCRWQSCEVLSGRKLSRRDWVFHHVDLVLLRW